MLKVFNSLQLVGLFAVSPFAINWLFSQATFTGANIVGWIACIIYVIFFIIMTSVVCWAMDDKSGWL